MDMISHIPPDPLIKTERRKMALQMADALFKLGVFLVGYNNDISL